jgi:hypothetical protein
MMQDVLFVGGKLAAFGFTHATRVKKLKEDVPKNRLNT